MGSESISKSCKPKRLTIKIDSDPIYSASCFVGPAFKSPHTMVEGGGFEPPKAEPPDLQSGPFDRSGTPPVKNVNRQCSPVFTYVSMAEIDPTSRISRRNSGARRRDRTSDLLITNQLLYQLSYAGRPARTEVGPN